MLDTVIFNLGPGAFKITRPEMFHPSASILNGPGMFLVPCVNNPTAEDHKAGRYMPCMTLIKRPGKRGGIFLKVQFSAAKMLFGNNVNELVEHDFNKVVFALGRKMFDMGVATTKTALADASISSFHPAKNIVMSNGYTTNFVIRELEKINLTQRMDLDKSNYRNVGHSVQYYANSHALVFYDKRYDLVKPEKRAIDKDQNSLQASLFDDLYGNGIELFRMEARPVEKRKMNKILAEVGSKKDPTFAEIFSSALCQKILLKYWREMVHDQNLFLFGIEGGSQALYRGILKKHPTMYSREGIYLVGLNTLAKDKDGIRGLRRLVDDKNKSARTWYRVSKDFKKLQHLPFETHGWVSQIECALRDFKPFAYPLKRV